MQYYGELSAIYILLEKYWSTVERNGISTLSEERLDGKLVAPV